MRSLLIFLLFYTQISFSNDIKDLEKNPKLISYELSLYRITANIKNNVYKSITIYNDNIVKLNNTSILLTRIFTKHNNIQIEDVVIYDCVNSIYKSNFNKTYPEITKPKLGDVHQILGDYSCNYLKI